MKRRFTKFAAIGMASALIMSLTAIPTSAAYTAVSGTSTTFNKYLVVDSDTTVPTLSFNYTVAPGTAQPATASTMAVLAGVGTPTIAAVPFTSSSATYDSVQGTDGVTLDSGEKYAKNTATVDFSGVSFDEPGIYRYIVTEATPTVSGVTYDTQAPQGATATQRVLDVYVTDNNGTLVVSSYVLHASATTVAANATKGSNDPDGETAANKVADKSDGYVNEYHGKDLEFGKEVEGNQGSKDKYFKFTLTLTGANPSTTYTVDISNAEAAPTATAATTYSTMANAATITTDTSGAATADYYLKDGQYIKVNGLPAGAVYTVAEDEEDYEKTPTIAASVAEYGGNAHTDAVSGTMANADVYTGFVNTRDGVIPTGVIVTIAPFAIGILLFGALGLFMVSKRRRENF